ncbi:hypothetical protein IW146_001396 [Coemansia sp. RSA 922]|nr:hypothetical protein IW146_001396 [Coemansia sp. RSA 922]
MAIITALSVLPLNTPATIWCDSQAAIAMTRKLQNAADDSWSKSPFAYVVQFFIPRIRQRMAALRLKWIPGHKGNKGNEGNKAADKAAKEAQQQRQGWIVKQQEEVWATERLVKRVRLANGNVEIQENDLKETLEALNWSANSNGTWTHKNSWCHTNARDSNLCGFMLGVMFKVLLVVEREWAWYPQAYEEPEWKMCPRCNVEIEMQEHYFACTASRLILGLGGTVVELEAQSTPRGRLSTGQAMMPQADRWTMVRPLGLSAMAEFANANEGVEEIDKESNGPVAKWIEQEAKARTACVLIPRQWCQETAEVIVWEMAQYGEKGRDWASRSLASDKELKSVVQWQWAHKYQEHWLPWNDAQISKEEASTIRPKKRRALMHQPRPPDVECDDGTPVYPKEMEVRRLAEYKKLCQVLIDDWHCSRKSKVAGKGLWSINTRYS